MYKRGDIYVIPLGDIQKNSSIQKGTRPVIIISNNTSNKHSSVITVVPISKQRKNMYMPTHILLSGYGLNHISEISCEQPMSVDKSMFEKGKYVGHIDSEKVMNKIKDAIITQIS